VRGHALDHLGVAVRGHTLKAIGEVPVVGVGARRDPAADAGIQVAASRPSACGCSPQKIARRARADSRDDHVLGGADLGARFGHPLEERRNAGLVEVEAVKRVDRGLVDRDRHEAPIDIGQYAVLVGPPGGKCAEIPDHVLGVGVEDVGAILMVLQPIVADGIVAIAGQMGRRSISSTFAPNSPAQRSAIVLPQGRRPRPRHRRRTRWLGPLGVPRVSLWPGYPTHAPVEGVDGFVTG